jgi:transcriptional antiterminator NusG
MNMTETDKQWYVLRVASNKEDSVCETLNKKVQIENVTDIIGRILVPTVKEKRVKAGHARVFQRKLYPGYVFVEMQVNPDGTIPERAWFVIKETMGVGDFIGSGNKPSSMASTDADKMLGVVETSKEQPSLAIDFQKGDQVKIREGPFENFEGRVEEVNSQKGTVKVIVTVFGRATELELEYWQIEKG